MKTPEKIQARLDALARLDRMLLRRMKPHPRHSLEVTRLLEARAYWAVYSRALWWSTQG